MKKTTRYILLIILISIGVLMILITSSCDSNSSRASNPETTLVTSSGSTSSDTTLATSPSNDASSDPAMDTFMKTLPKFEYAYILGMKQGDNVFSIKIISYEYQGDFIYLHSSTMDLLVDKSNCVLMHNAK